MNDSGKLFKIGKFKMRTFGDIFGKFLAILNKFSKNFEYNLSRFFVKFKDNFITSNVGNLEDFQFSNFWKNK